MTDEEEDIAVPGGAADREQAEAKGVNSTPRADRGETAPGDSGIEPMTFDNPEAQQNEERDKTTRARARNVVLRAVRKTGWWWPDGS